MNGWLVVVETNPRGKSDKKIYAVNEPLQERSLSIVLEATRVGCEDVIGWAGISNEFLSALHVPKGQCRPIHAGQTLEVFSLTEAKFPA